MHIYVHVIEGDQFDDFPSMLNIIDNLIMFV